MSTQDRVVRLQRVLEHQEKVLARSKRRESETEAGTRAFWDLLRRADVDSVRKDQR